MVINLYLSYHIIQASSPCVVLTTVTQLTALAPDVSNVKMGFS